MIGRIMGTALAVLLTVICVLGIAVLTLSDVVGEEILIRGWRWITAEAHAPAASDEELAAAKDFTFFEQAKVAGHLFVIMTGRSYVDAPAWRADKVGKRWCYAIIDTRGGFPRRIDLAAQSGVDPPVFYRLTDQPALEFAAMGVAAATLEGLARSHCRLGRGNAGPAPHGPLPKAAG